MTLPAGVTEEMVEAAARALCRKINSAFQDGATLDARVEKHWRNYTGDARGALTAALAGRVVVPAEPNEEMISAVLDVLNSARTWTSAVGQDGHYADLYRAMIATIQRSTPSLSTGDAT